VAETILGSDWCPAFSMEIVKIRSGGVGWDMTPYGHVHIHVHGHGNYLSNHVYDHIHVHIHDHNIL